MPRSFYPARPPACTERRKPSAKLLLVVGGALVLIAFQVAAAKTGSNQNSFDDFPGVLSQPGIDSRDRLAILNLIHFYSHLADGLQTDLFGHFFSENAVFAIVPYGADPDDPQWIMGKSRAEIVDSLRPRHAAFRGEKVQRRHFLTNPIIWEQTRESARVGVYLQLHSITRGGASELVGTGRYEGRAIKTPHGWRISEWTIYSDQTLDEPT